MFAVPLKRFMGYQVNKFLPWWIQRYVFFNRTAKLEPLYHFDKGVVAERDSDMDSSIHEAPAMEGKL